MGRTRKVAVGFFLVAGLVLFAVGLFMIGDRRRLFDDSFEVRAEFARLAGLQNGSRVRVAGMNAGEVEEISYPASPDAKFVVRMRVLSDLHPLVREDSVATIQTDGIVGNKLLEIGTGSSSSDLVEDGGRIDSREPFQLGDLLEKASEVVSTVDASIRSLRGEIEETVSSFAEVVDRANGLLQDVGQDVEDMSHSAKTITDDVEVMVARVKAGQGSIGKLVNDEELYRQTVAVSQRVAQITDDAAEVMANVKGMTEEARTMVENLESDESPAPGLMADLAQAIKSAREAMSDMAENMESVKRNFLFRGMFEERGFFDIDSLTLEEYLNGGLSDRNHNTLRIWLPADDLYDMDARSSKLSVVGKAAIDSAMREILRYPGNSPLMVEGYWSAGSLDERFVAARGLAFAVYEYVVRTYHRDPNYTGFIAMESVSPDNVEIDHGDSGSGVVLSLFHDGDDAVAPRHRIIH